ncbi:glycosyltransferase [Methylosinus sp. Ce-a6]|uniref:glycosyltransferase n=1 Tax=Methylosinus sp. Ce-a6 TaxID=2172005 RepID=UPI00135BC8DE|nr:glycosyltransferase [Methylosinus sp. Ce-a6]
MRADVRGDASVANVEAQREFAAWWVVRAREEFPDIWSVDDELSQIACEPRLLLHDLPLPRLLALIYESRADLRAAFPLPPRRNVASLARWYQKFAHREYSYAPPLPDWFLAEHLPSGAGSKPRGPMPEQRVIRRPPGRFEPRGVNLIGYPRAEFGIGEDVRMVSSALEEVGVPHIIFDVRDGCSARQKDVSREGKISEVLPYEINIVCVSAFDAARLWLRQERRLFAGHYNIGYWPWELERFPIEWADALDLVDEIWGASSFTTATYASLAGDRVKLMPPSVAVTAVAETGTRDDEIYRFLCPFDPNSAMERKNPAAAARAFVEAFPAEISDVRLVFAVNGALPEHRQTQVLRDASRADARIEIREGTLERSDYHRLIAQSNCLVSPHRAEGFGRNIAEAKALGVAVIATGYSGSNDFLDARERVSWSPISVGAADYPYSVGAPWADVQIDDLAEKMRAFYDARISTPIAPLSDDYSVAAAGRRYKARLDDIAAGRADVSSNVVSLG